MLGARAVQRRLPGTIRADRRQEHSLRTDRASEVPAGALRHAFNLACAATAKKQASGKEKQALLKAHAPAGSYSSLPTEWPHDLSSNRRLFFARHPGCTWPSTTGCNDVAIRRRSTNPIENDLDHVGHAWRPGGEQISCSARQCAPRQ